MPTIWSHNRAFPVLGDLSHSQNIQTRTNIEKIGSHIGSTGNHTRYLLIERLQCKLLRHRGRYTINANQPGNQSVAPDCLNSRRRHFNSYIKKYYAIPPN